MLKFLLNPKFLPSLMIVLDIVAAIVYGCNRDWKHMVYWLAGAVMITAITF